MYFVDIDECVKYDSICGPNSNCTNLIGSYNCTCLHGYRLDLPEVKASINNPCKGVCALLSYVTYYFTIIYVIFMCLTLCLL